MKFHMLSLLLAILLVGAISISAEGTPMLTASCSTCQTDSNGWAQVQIYGSGFSQGKNGHAQYTLCYENAAQTWCDIPFGMNSQGSFSVGMSVSTLGAWTISAYEVPQGNQPRVFLTSVGFTVQ